jgi:hypothetical protein
LLSQSFFDEVRKSYDLAPGEQALLVAAEQAWSRWQAIVAKIDAEGLTTQGRWGPVANPLLGPEARARQGVIAAIRALNLKEL